MTATAQQTYYEILGVAENAPQGEIRKAYHKLARKYHPDKTGGDKAAEEKLKKINNAYDTLKNQEKRKVYDKALRNPFGQDGAYTGGPQWQNAGFGASGGFGGNASFSDIFGSDIFGDLFGARSSGRSQGPVPGQDLAVTLKVSLKEAAEGITKTIRVPRAISCPACKGSGAKSGTQPKVCPQCQGTGVQQQQGGAYFVSRPCSKCRGSGQIIETPCALCRGTGRTKENRTVSAKIPAGAEDGLRLRLAGQGGAGMRNGPAGDLYVEIEVIPDPRFTRQNDDLLCEVTVPFTGAALGTTIRVPTLQGQVDLRVPEGTQPGQVLRMRGLGMPRLNGTCRGDQKVRVQVSVPKRLTKEQRTILERLRETERGGSSGSAAA